MVLLKLVTGGVGLVVVKKFVNSLDNDEKLAEEDYDHMPPRAVMSMLVHCTYFRDLRKVEEAAAWILDYNNSRAKNYGKLYWTSYPCQASESELKDLGLAFLRRNYGSNRNPNAPGLAIVLRGTIPTNLLDLSADLKIGVQRLNQSDRVLRTVELILQVVKKFRRENPGEQIGMAGHSLGAAIALIVGGYLYSTHDIDIDTHLFNPPLLTLVDVGVDVIRRLAPAYSDGSDDHDGELKICFSKLKEALVGNATAAVYDEWIQFQKLQRWVPRFYLNPGDEICRRYINFYKGRRGQPLETPGDVISSQGILSGLFSENVKYFKNVVPSADLYISTWEEGDIRLAHSLRQWHKYRPEYIQLHDYEVRLLGTRTSSPGTWYPGRSRNSLLQEPPGGEPRVLFFYFMFV